MNYSLQTLPETERPRERLLLHGSEAMTNRELIAIILGSGTRSTPVLQLADQVMYRFETLKALFEASIEEICQISGMGKAKAIQLKAALSLGMRVAKESMEDRSRVQTPNQVYELIKDTVANETRELFMVVLLDTKGGVIGHHVVAIGTLSRTLVHPREVFFQAVRRKAASIILAHNHPSGDTTPSTQDIEVTDRLIEAGKTMGIPVHDHIIIGNKGYLSLREKGVCFL